MDSSKGKGNGFDPTIELAGGIGASFADAERQRYLDTVADEEEAGVEAMQQQIEHLKTGLTAKKAEAKAARAAANAGPEN